MGSVRNHKHKSKYHKHNKNSQSIHGKYNDTSLSDNTEAILLIHSVMVVD